MPEPIDPDKVPGRNLRPDLVSLAAVRMRSAAASTVDSGNRVVCAWQGMRPHYEAPEADLLLGVMHPVRRTTDRAGDNARAVAGALDTYAMEMAQVKAALDAVREGAVALRADVAACNGRVDGVGADGGGVNLGPVLWTADRGLVDRNNDLLGDLDAQLTRLLSAEQACAKAIRAVAGAPSFLLGPGRGISTVGLPVAPPPWGQPVAPVGSFNDRLFVDAVLRGALGKGLVDLVLGLAESLATRDLGYNPQTGAWGDLKAMTEERTHAVQVLVGTLLWLSPLTMAVAMKSASGPTLRWLQDSTEKARLAGEAAIDLHTFHENKWVWGGEVGMTVLVALLTDGGSTEARTAGALGEAGEAGRLGGIATRLDRLLADAQVGAATTQSAREAAVYDAARFSKADLTGTQLADGRWVAPSAERVTVPDHELAARYVDEHEFSGRDVPGHEPPGEGRPAHEGRASERPAENLPGRVDRTSGYGELVRPASRSEAARELKHAMGHALARVEASHQGSVDHDRAAGPSPSDAHDPHSPDTATDADGGSDGPNEGGEQKSGSDDSPHESMKHLPQGSDYNNEEWAKRTVESLDHQVNQYDNRIQWGHGHSRHGYQVTEAQVDERARTGLTPDNKLSKSGSVTKFRTAQSEAEAFVKGRDKLASAIRGGDLKPIIDPGTGRGAFVRTDGSAIRFETSVSTTDPQGFGNYRAFGLRIGGPSSVYKMAAPGVREIAVDRAPIRHAIVVFEYVVRSARWELLTYYPESR